jgi:Ion transport protein
MPQSNFKMFWNFVIILLLLYTATWMPYQICFIDEPSKGVLLGFEYFIDCLFALDILFNFISAYEKSDGSIETRAKNIALNYMKLWFIIDAFAIVPL